MVEDIDFLKENSIKENFVLFIDSAQRDKIIGLTPAEYTVDFDEPFKNVFGLEILDANIPRTMYIVDIYNDTFSYTLRYNNINYQNTIRFDNQDYNIDTLITELNTNLSYTIPFTTNTFTITASSLSTPYIRKSVIYYESKYPFIFDFTKRPMAEVLGFDDYTNDKFSNLYKALDYQIFGSIRSVDVGKEIHKYCITDIDTEQDMNTFNPDPIFDNNPTFDLNNHLKKKNYVSIYKNNSAFQIFNRPEDLINFPKYARSINNITLYIGIQNKTSFSSLSSLNIKWEIRKVNIATNTFYENLASGIIINNSENVIISKIEKTTLPDRINSIYKVKLILDSNDYNLVQYEGDSNIIKYCFILHEDTKTENDKINNIYIDGIDTDYIEGGLIWYTSIKNNNVLSTEVANTFIWDNSINLENQNNLLINNLLEYADVNGIIEKNVFFLEIESSYKQFKLTPSGRVSLIGERFIILRCPEIESQLSGSYGFGKNSPGLALFKLGVLGYAEARFDFSSIEYKEFHPIGKLTKLHFRFETATGKLYDFKGVNHNLLIVVKYLRPNNNNISKKNKYFPLNQNYNPNLIEYLKTQNDVADQYSTDEEDNDFLQKNFNKIYLEKEQEYINSSDDDLDVNLTKNSDFDSEEDIV